MQRQEGVAYVGSKMICFPDHQARLSLQIYGWVPGWLQPNPHTCNPLTGEKARNAGGMPASLIYNEQEIKFAEIKHSLFFFFLPVPFGIKTTRKKGESLLCRKIKKKKN